MEQFDKVELLPSKRPKFFENEIEVLILESKLLDSSNKAVHKKGTVTLTTHRMIYGNPKFTGGFSLGKIEKVDQCGKLFRKDKVEITFIGGYRVYFQLKKPKFADSLEKKTLEKMKEKKWIVKEVKEPEYKFSTRKAGIAGIEMRMKKADRDQKRTLSKAFGDLDTLMTKAEELVKIAEVFNGKNLTEDENSELKSMLSDIGIGSIVTKSSTGSRFHSELSRQLCDVLVKPLEKSKGMMTVTDAYCLYNRIRGTDLISPDDMLKACELFSTLELPLALKQFSNVKVVVDAKNDTAETNKKILELMEGNGKGFVSAVEVAKKMEYPVLLAKILLEEGENTETFARDECEEGVLYFKNIFGEFSIDSEE